MNVTNQYQYINQKRMLSSNTSSKIQSKIHRHIRLFNTIHTLSTQSVVVYNSQIRGRHICDRSQEC